MAIVCMMTGALICLCVLIYIGWRTPSQQIAPSEIDPTLANSHQKVVRNVETSKYLPEELWLALGPESKQFHLKGCNGLAVASSITVIPPCNVAFSMQQFGS